jgi:nicotinamidase-related amidase
MQCTGNRVFNGYACEGHPVRQVHEMLNVLLKGSIEFSDGHRARLWSGDAFAATDLVAYLAGSTTHADFAGAMVEVDVETPIGDQCLISQPLDSI